MSKVQAMGNGRVKVTFREEPPHVALTLTDGEKRDAYLTYGCQYGISHGVAENLGDAIKRAANLADIWMDQGFGATLEEVTERYNT